MEPRITVLTLLSGDLSGHGGFSIGHNVNFREAVNAIMEQAARAEAGTAAIFRNRMGICGRLSGIQSWLCR